MNKKHAEELSQSLKALGTGWCQQILWAIDNGVPEALGYRTAEEWMRRRLSAGQVAKLFGKRAL